MQTVAVVTFSHYDVHWLPIYESFFLLIFCQVSSKAAQIVVVELISVNKVTRTPCINKYISDINKHHKE